MAKPYPPENAGRKVPNRAPGPIGHPPDQLGTRTNWAPPGRPRPNREHFHVWATSAGDDGNSMLYRLARGFGSRTAAKRWAARWYPDRETMVLQCKLGDDCRHKPKL